MDVEPQLLAEPSTSDADSLVSSNDPDDMANEQTWPPEVETRAAQNANGNGHPDAIPDAKAGTTPKTVRKVPKGTSEYQAAWIIDESDEEDGEGQGMQQRAWMGGEVVVDVKKRATERVRRPGRILGPVSESQPPRRRRPRIVPGEGQTER